MMTWRQKVLSAAAVLMVASFAVHTANEWLMPAIPTLIVVAGLVALYSLIFRR